MISLNYFVRNFDKDRSCNISTEFFKDFTSVLVFAQNNSKRSRQLILLFGVLFGIIGITGQNVPFYYIFYYFSPFFVWADVIPMVYQLKIMPATKQKNSLTILTMVSNVIIIIACLILAFFDRRAVAIALFFLLLIHWNQKHLLSSFIWMSLCLALAAFTFQPSVGKERSPYLVFGSAMVSSAFFWIILERIKNRALVFKISIFYLIISGICVVTSDYNGSKVFSWIVLVTALPMSFFSESGLLERLLALNMGIMSMYQLFSLTYEALFLTFLTMAMFCWLYLGKGNLQLKDLPLGGACLNSS